MTDWLILLRPSLTPTAVGRKSGCLTLVLAALASICALAMAFVDLLAREPDALFAQQQDTNNELPLHSDNGAPRSIWSNNSTIWVSDFVDRKVYAYSLETGSRLETKDIDLGNFNFKAYGLWSDGSDLWVLNTRDDKVYGYSLSTETRQEGNVIRLDSDNDIPTGIWSDGTTMWVVDQNDKKLYAYRLDGWARQSDRDVDLSIDRPRPLGVWSDGRTFWISYDYDQSYTDHGDHRLYAFSLENGARQEERDVEISRDSTNRPGGLWSDGSTMWVVDTTHKKLFAYDLPRAATSSDASLKELSVTHGTLSPVFASSTTSYTASVDYEVTEVTLSATTTDDSARVSFLDSTESDLADADVNADGHQVSLGVGNNVIKVRVTAEDDETVETYTVTIARSKAEVSIGSSAVEVVEGNDVVFTVSRDAALVETLDVKVSIAESESLVPDSQEGSRTVTIQPGATSTVVIVNTDINDDSWEVHSTVKGTIVEEDGYSIQDNSGSAETLVKDDDFPTATAELTVSPNPVVEGGTASAIVTVTTNADHEPHGDGGAIALSQQDGTAGVSDYGSLSQTSIQIDESDFSIANVDGDTRYRAVYTASVTTHEDNEIEVGESFVVAMSKSDGASTNLEISPPAEVVVSISDNDASLSALGLSDLTLSPEFSSDIYSYTANGDYSLTETTVHATSTHTDFSAPTIKLNGSVDADGTIPLMVGNNEITVEVTAEDAVTTKVYTVTVTRAKPVVSITSEGAEADEGQNVAFKVIRDAAVADPLEVEVSVTETEDLVPDSEQGNRRVTIPGHAASTTLTVSTDVDDDIWEDHSTITTTIVNNDAYTSTAGSDSTVTQVKDNDFPEAATTLTVAPNPVAEGGTVAITLRVTTNADQKPHGGGGTLTLSAEQGTARPSDYGRFGQTSFDVAPDDFGTSTVGGTTRYQAVYTAAIVITDDGDTEDDETFRISIDKLNAPKIALPSTATTSVTISANDFSSDPSLGDLKLSRGTLTPSFTSGTTSYTASVGFAVEQITVSAIKNSDNAAISILDGDNSAIGDANDSIEGHQVNLKVGQNVVKVSVTAGDTTTTQVYTVVVVRAKPVVSISTTAAEETEGNSLRFRLSRNSISSDDLDVKVNVDETGQLMADIEEGARMVTIPGTSTSTTFTVTTDLNDSTWEEHSTVKATISKSDAYAIKPDENHASVELRDDDFPTAVATLSLDQHTVDEGEIATLTITVTTDGNQQPHGGGGTLTLTTAGGTAQDSDYGSLSQTTFSIGAEEYSPTDIGGGVTRFRNSYTATMEISDDNENEPEETVLIQLAKGEDASQISIGSPASSTLTIASSDASSDASLSGLSLSEGTLTPDFASSTTSYTSSVGYEVERITLVPTVRDDTAVISISMNTVSSGPTDPIDLVVGPNTIHVVVTAQDETSSRIYTIVVTRAKPEVSISSTTTEVAEGEEAILTIKRNAPVSKVLDVNVNISETGSLVPDSHEGSKTVTIPAWATTTALTIATDVDDELWEEHSDITASIVSGLAYTTNESNDSTEVRVNDDDFPMATAMLSASPNPVAEGETLTATISVVTDANEIPHSSGGTLTLDIGDGTAQPSDYGSLSKTSFLISDSDFTLDAGTNTYRSEYTATILIAKDSEVEVGENFIVSMSRSGDSPASLALGQPTSVTVDINDHTIGLLDLKVSGVALVPTFSSDTLKYTATVPYSLAEIMVTATTTAASAPVPTIKLNGVLNTENVFPLLVGDNPITIEVTGEGSDSDRTYTVVVTRQAPEVSVHPGSTEVSEGEVLGFTLNRSSADPDILEVRISVTEDGTLVPEGSEGEGVRSVVIPKGATSTTFAVATEEDDDIWEPHSKVTVTVLSRDSYTIAPGEGKAETSVMDDDFPEATAALSVNPNVVAEGGKVTARVTVTTARNEVPHADSGQISITTANDTAISGTDYTDLAAPTGIVSFTASDFSPHASSSHAYYEASKNVEIRSVIDSDLEGPEKFSVILSRVTTGESPTDDKIALDAGSQILSVTILDSPESELSTLSLSAGTLIPAFTASTTDYAANVDYGDEQITVTATTSRDNTRITVLDGTGREIPDADDHTEGHQVGLIVGENIVKLRVTAQDDSLLQTYTVSVTRAKPRVSVNATTTNASEGADVEFTVSRDAAVSEPLQVVVSVTETHSMVTDPFKGEGSRTVTIPPHATSTTLTVITDTDDGIWEEHSTVRAAIQADVKYTVSANEGSAETPVLDNDFPEATAELAVSPSPVREGRSVALLVTVETLRDEKPHAGAGTIEILVVGETASSSDDFVPLGDSLITFNKGDFKAVSLVNGEQRYQATKQVSIETIEDDKSEEPESITVKLVRVLDGDSPTARNLVLDPNAEARTVTITDDVQDQTQGGGNDQGGSSNDDGGQSSGSDSGGSGGGGGGSSSTSSNRRPAFSENDGVTRSIAENSPIGTKVGRRVSAIDSDGDRLNYSLGGGAQFAFTINERTGQLYSASELDREVTARYYLTVNVSDGKGGDDSIEVIIVVTDVNEAPTLTGESVINRPEETIGVVTTYSSADPENGTIEWVLSGDDAELFSIDKGALAFRVSPDYEDPRDADRDNIHMVRIEVHDGAHKRTLDVSIYVTDVYDPPTPTPTPIPVPSPTPAVTVAPTALPTSTATPEPTETPSPTKTPTATPTSTPVSTPKPTETSTPSPTSTITPVPSSLSTPAPTPTLVPPVPTLTATRIPVATPLLARTPTPTPTVEATVVRATAPTFDTPTQTPLPLVSSTGSDSVPAWLLLSITFWAILATGIGVYAYVRQR